MNAMRNFLALACVVVALCATSNVRADFTFGEPVKFGSVHVLPTDDIDCFSSDGLEMYIDRWLSADNIDLYVLKRASVDDDWGPPMSLGPAVNSPQQDWLSSISADGLTLYFQSNRPGGFGSADIYMTTRASRSAPWGPAVNLGPTINTSAIDADVWISADGLELYFMSTRSGGYGGFDLYVSRRATTNDPWGNPVNLGPVVNSAYNEDGVGLSPDGLLLLFDDNGKPRPGGYGNSDFWMTRRASLSDPWQTPVNLGPRINGPGVEFPPRISPDGRTLYFGSNRTSPWDSWQAPILPIVDFNGDGIVDIKDLLRLIESWGRDDPSVDMGPMPWGDGKIDAADLEVLMGYWQQKVLPVSLLAYWKLDEVEGTTAADKAGTNNATLVGNPIWQPAGGEVGGALQLDGIDDYVRTPFVVDPAKGPFSVFAWIKGGAPGQVVVSQVDGANWLMLDSATGALKTDLQRGGRLGKALCSDMAITDGNWHRIGFAWDNSNRTLYVDDAEVARDAQVSLAGSTGYMTIGTGSTLAVGTFWKGLIDDVRLYNRVVKP
jgi:hypothetical protein